MSIPKTFLKWIFEAATKLGVVLSIIIAIISLTTGQAPTQVVAMVSVAVNNTIELTAQPFPITAQDAELLRAWACTEIPDHTACN